MCFHQLLRLTMGFAKLPVFMFCFLLLLLDHLLYMLNLFWKVSVLQTTCLLVHHTVSDTLYRCTFTVLELGVSYLSIFGISETDNPTLLIKITVKSVLGDLL